MRETTRETLIKTFEEVCHPKGRSPLKEVLTTLPKDKWPQLAERMIWLAEEALKKRPKLQAVRYTPYGVIFSGSDSLGRGCLGISLYRDGGVVVGPLRGRYGCVVALNWLIREIRAERV